MLRGPSCHAARPTLSYRAPHTVMLRAVAASRKSSCKDLSLDALDSATGARNDKVRRVDALFAQLRQAQLPRVKTQGKSRTRRKPTVLLLNDDVTVEKLARAAERRDCEALALPQAPPRRTGR